MKLFTRSMSSCALALAMLAGNMQAVTQVMAEDSAAEELKAEIAALPSSVRETDDVNALITKLADIKTQYEALTEEEQAVVDNIAVVDELLDGNSASLDPSAMYESYQPGLGGKTIGYLGSSITYGFATDGIAFPEYIARMTGSTSVKQAISGGPLALKEGVRDEISYITQLHTGAITPETDLDALVVQLSTNDAALGIEMGEISDSTSSADMDVSTINGAMEYIIAYAQETWDCPVLFYINPPLNDEMVTKYAEAFGTDEDAIRTPYVDVYGDMIDAVYELQKKWDIEIIDLWNKDELSEVSWDVRTYMMNDPIHPKKSGYLFWYTPEMIRKITSAVISAQNAVKLTEVDGNYVYSAAENGYTDDLCGLTHPTFYVYAGQKTRNEAAALISEMNMKDVLQENVGTVVYVNPVDGKAYGEADAEAFPMLLGAAVSNAKVIGIDEGADFVNNCIAPQAYAVAGIMTVDGTVAEGTVADYKVPAYVVNSSDEVVDLYVKANGAVETGEGVWTNPDEPLAKVVSAKEVVLSSAFANAWEQIFSRNYREDNVDTEFYMSHPAVNKVEYDLISICNFDELGIQYNPYYSVPLNGEGEYTWFEYIPETTLSAADGTVPLVISLHGNGNDARIQGETTGWPELGAKEGFMVVAPEWQDVVVDSETHTPGPNAFNCDGLEREKLIEWIEMLKVKYPQIDASRIYITGLSAGASASTLYGALYENYFAAAAAVSGPGVDKDELTEVVKTYAGEEMPYLYVAGDHDFFGMLPVDGSSPYQFQVAPGVGISAVDPNCSMFAFIQAYQAINGIEVTEDYDLTVNPYYGIALENEQWIKIGQKDALEGSLSNANGEIIRLAAMKDQAHWNYKGEAEYIWNFFKEYSRDTETGKLVRESAIRVTEKKNDAAEVFGYDAAYLRTADSEHGLATPVFLVYPDHTVTRREADALVEELGLFDRCDEETGTVYVINPTDGTYGEDDAEAFVKLLDVLTPMAMNTKLIGIGEGATFINTQLNDKLWSVAGVMTYGGEAGGELKYAVPAYVSNGDASQYKKAASSVFETVVEAKDETLAEASQNAWDQVFVKNGRVGNITGTFYSMPTSIEREFEYFTYLDCESQKLVRTVVKDVDFDGDGVMNLWYEYVPESVVNAKAGTVPMVLMLHGNTNDPRTQANTSGWSKLASENGIILVEPEWQGGMVNGVLYDAMTENDSTSRDNDIIKMVEAVKAKYPQIDPERIYVEGLSRGSLNTMTLCLTHPEVFAAGGSHSGAVIGDLMNTGDVDKIVEELKDDYNVPWFFIAGEKDGFVPVSEKGAENSGVLGGLNLFEKMDELPVTKYEDCDEAEIEWFGFPCLKNFREKANTGSCVIKGGEVLDADGNAVLSFNVVENWGHWNYEPGAQLMWEFFQQHTLNEDVKTVVPEDKPTQKPSTGVDTGDSFNAGIFGGLMAACAGLAAAVWFSLKNRA